MIFAAFKAFKLGGVTKEQWEVENRPAKCWLGDRLAAARQHHASNTVTRIYDMLLQILFENPKNGPRETTAASTTLDPMISRLQELAGRPAGDADYQKLKNEIS